MLSTMWQELRVVDVSIHVDETRELVVIMVAGLGGDELTASDVGSAETKERSGGGGGGGGCGGGGARCEVAEEHFSSGRIWKCYES